MLNFHTEQITSDIYINDGFWSKGKILVGNNDTFFPYFW